MSYNKRDPRSAEDLRSDTTKESAFDRAFSDAFPELSSGNESVSAAASSTSEQASALPSNQQAGAISSDTCDFYLAGTSISEQPGKDPLDALDANFRSDIGWKMRPGVDPSFAADLVIGMQRPYPELIEGSESRFLAVDQVAYRGQGLLDRASHQDFWEDQINGRPFSEIFLKSGAAIWKQLGIKVPAETTAYMMRMKSVDSETSEAIQAALWSTFNTARYPIDMESAIFVLASFIHSDPLRKRLVSDEKFVHPFGDRTAYVLLKTYKQSEE